MSLKHNIEMKINLCKTIHSFIFPFVYVLYVTFDRCHSNHQNKTIDYLKIDTEGSEWRILRHMLETGILTNKVRQLGIEIHLDGRKSIDEFRLSAKLLRSLEKMDMVRFDSKHNPWYKGNFESL